MKKLGIVFLGLLSVFAFVACQSSSDTKKVESESFMATIVTVEGEQLMANGPEDKFPEVLVNMKERDTKVLLADGSKGALSDLVAGQKN